MPHRADSTGFENWLNGARAALTTPAVAATDPQSYTWFSSRNVPALLLRDTARLPLHMRFLYIRASVTHRLLALGMRVLFSEMDVFWINDPLIVESRMADLQVCKMYMHVSTRVGLPCLAPLRASPRLARRGEART